MTHQIARPATAPRLSEMHDLGGHRHGLDGGRRRAALAPDRQRRGGRRPSFSFAQISDSHLGFDKPANPNVTATLQEALDDVGKLPKKPAFMIHTGDITHLSKPAQFDTAAQLLRCDEADDAHRARRARHPGGRRQELPQPLRQGHQGRRLVQLRRQRRALHRPGQRGEPAGQRPGRPRARAARVAGEGREAPVRQHADRGVRARAAVDRVPGLGLGHRGRRAGAVAT